MLFKEKKPKAKAHKLEINNKKRLTTVPQFESTKKLMEENTKVILLVDHK